METSGRRPQLPWGKALRASASGTLNLVVAGSAGLGAAALHSLPVLGLGALAFGALVAWDLTQPAFWKRVIRGGEPGRAGLPKPGEVDDPATRRSLLALVAAKAELERVLAESPAQVKSYLTLALGGLAEMEERAARLIERAGLLGRYLGGVKPEAVRSEIAQLDLQAARTLDAEARGQFLEARAARDEQLRTLQELQGARDRVQAHLSRIVAAYEALPARIVHLRALDAQAADAASGDVSHDLDRMNAEVAAFEDTLKTLSVKVPA